MRISLHSACYLNIAILVLAALTKPASAQEPPPPRPGLFDELGKLLKTPADFFPSRSNSDVAKPDAVPEAPLAAAPAPPASPAPTVEPPAASTRLFPGMATGREVCPLSANGVPDCQAGADKLCQNKGYKGGKSLNTDSAFSCSSRQARAEGRKPCGTEHFVTSAFCN